MRYALVVSALTCALFLACGGSGEPEPASPTPDLSGNLSPTVGGVEAMRRYIRDVGLDGRRGTLTDPLDCAEAAVADDVDGDFCIAQAASVYAPGLVILFVGEPDSYEKKAWQAHIERGGDGWEVRDVTLHEED